MWRVWDSVRKGSSGGWYCPNGHSRVFRESDAEKVRREMQQQLDQAASRLEFYRREVKSQKRELTATKSRLTKTNKRISNGVCPVCRRNFVALGRHIRGQHPDYCKETAARSSLET